MRRIFFAVAAIAVFALAGCTMSDDQLGRLMVAPDKYALYNCSEIARAAQAAAAREAELQRLMARAGTDAGGRLMSSLAYDSDYLTVRGEINEMRAAAAAKHCDAAPNSAPVQRASERATR